MLQRMSLPDLVDCRPSNTNKPEIANGWRRKPPRCPPPPENIFIPKSIVNTGRKSVSLLRSNLSRKPGMITGMKFSYPFPTHFMGRKMSKQGYSLFGLK